MAEREMGDVRGETGDNVRQNAPAFPSTPRPRDAGKSPISHLTSPI